MRTSLGKGLKTYALKDPVGDTNASSGECSSSLFGEIEVHILLQNMVIFPMIAFKVSTEIWELSFKVRTEIWEGSEHYGRESAAAGQKPRWRGISRTM